MSNEKLRDLLATIHEEMQKTDADAETRVLMRKLDADIHRSLEQSATETDRSALVEQARKLESRLAADHPTAERVMREVVDALVKIGI